MQTDLTAIKDISFKTSAWSLAVIVAMSIINPHFNPSITIFAVFLFLASAIVHQSFEWIFKHDIIIKKSLPWIIPITILLGAANISAFSEEFAPIFSQNERIVYIIFIIILDVIFSFLILIYLILWITYLTPILFLIFLSFSSIYISRFCIKYVSEKSLKKAAGFYAFFFAIEQSFSKFITSIVDYLNTF